jgi:hypothetical protein
MVFNDLYCLARPQVHTLSCGVAQPSDFDEHVAALEHYDRAAEMVAPIEQKLRAEMHRTLGGDWCGQCQFLEFLGVPGEKDRQPHCRLFLKRLRRAAISSVGILRLGDCVAAENVTLRLRREP